MKFSPSTLMPPEQWYQLAQEKFNNGEPVEARKLLEQALKAFPGHRELYSQLLYILMASQDLTPPQVFEWFQRASDFYQPLPQTSALNHSPEPWRRLKIGYVSGDFRNHALARVCSPLFQYYDPRFFEVYIYSNSTQVDETTHWFKQHCDHWRELQTLSSSEAARLIQADGIDILVDLSGHTAGCRLDLFAQRLAPVQATVGLGIIATTGLKTVDYRLADPALVPPQLAPFNSEEVVQVRHHLRWDPPEILLQLPLQPPPSLKNGYITFGTANRLYKLNTHVLDLWASILKAVPDSRLALKCSQLDLPKQRERLQQAFQARDISAERLIFSGQTTTPEHIAWQSEIDIALDPFPYQGALTSFEALFMGVPVVALNYPGGSRGALSILDAINLTDLIANSPRQYFEIAVSLARQPDALLNMRQHLRAQLLNSPIFDGLSYTREIENTWRWLWLRYLNQQQPLPGTLSSAPDCTPPELPEPNRAYLDRLRELAVHFFEIELHARSEALCHEILRQSPDEHSALHLLGLIAFRIGEFQAAENLIQQAITKSPLGVYYLNLGNILSAQGRQAEAQTSWQQAIKQDPELVAHLSDQTV